MNFGRLRKIDIRELWLHEQYDFSDWLSKEENIDLLNDTLGLTLTEISKEVFVGSYRCDLVAKDEMTGIRVIIENQLEASNHDHLGKIITYASGLDAKVVVWIVKEAREEHRSAVEWLNNNLVKDVSFFLLEIQAYRIGDSFPAPKFEIIEKPNDFIQSIKSMSADGEMSQTQSERLNFWSKFNEKVTEHGKPFNIRKASTDHWYDVALGTSEAHITITLVNKKNTVGIEVYINDNKEMYDRIHNSRDKIHSELGFELIWQRLDKKKASRIIYYIDGLNFNDHSNYSELMDKVIKLTVKIKDVFALHL